MDVGCGFIVSLEATGMVGRGSGSDIRAIYDRSKKAYVGFARWDPLAAQDGIAFLGNGSTGFLPIGVSYYPGIGFGGHDVYRWFVDSPIYGSPNIIDISYYQEIYGYQQPQNPTVGPDDLRAYRTRIEKMLTEPKCKQFLNELLNEARTETGKSYSDILTTFDQIKFFWGATGSHGGEAHFYQGAPAATIENSIVIEKPSGSMANQKDRREFLISQTTQGFLGETLHHVGEGYTYRDGVMANALNAILVRKGLDTPQQFSDLNKTDIDNASIYWHPKLWAACPAPRK
jgi:hypothetical protein